MVTRRGMLTVMGSIVTVTLAGAAAETRIARSGSENGQTPTPVEHDGVVVAPVDAPLVDAEERAERDSRHTGG
ncbi:hypothetical protein [Flexivirga meconopsidis]|uniref:hypothetical protein n=1 Tax=Flexivirga meconopsidis TaxID=2977121 RepID=UPI002240E22B|nr:hypothetical protein [Flexivirga meconopsidis]